MMFWKWLTFGADHIQHGWLSTILVFEVVEVAPPDEITLAVSLLTKRRAYQSHSLEGATTTVATDKHFSECSCS